MQSTTVNGITFTYPDDPCMIFNIVPISASGTMDRLRVYMSHGLRNYDITYNTPNGGVVDVREYLQSLFDGLIMGADIDYTQQLKASELGMTCNFTLQALNSGGTVLAQHNFSLFCLWGGLKAGELFNQLRTVTWFKNYPFTVGYYASAAQTATVGPNDAPSTLVTIPAQGFYNILIDDAMGGQYMTIYDIMGNLALSTFDDTFDLTFSYTLDGTQAERIRIHLVDECVDEGIYLRWIDRHGFWNYYLFCEGNVNRNVGTNGLWYRNELANWEEIYHWQRDAGRRQNLTRNDVLPVCAPLVDQDTFDMLQDVTTSPCVDMYLGKDENNVPKWTAVTIEAGTYVKDVKKPEQDFVMNIILPEIPIQDL